MRRLYAFSASTEVYGQSMLGDDHQLVRAVGQLLDFKVYLSTSFSSSLRPSTDSGGESAVNQNVNLQPYPMTPPSSYEQYQLSNCRHATLPTFDSPPKESSHVVGTAREFCQHVWEAGLWFMDHSRHSEWRMIITAPHLATIDNNLQILY
ncbi:hypothetical protein WG66_002617 [Moniliophthora roreri]|nr:hypothetical protein WG66_002617 [Moniliophthora roreri]